MLGAIIGDVIGSIYESEAIKTEDFPLFSRFSRFTDDTVLTIAVADAILHRVSHRFGFIQSWRNTTLYAQTIKAYGRRFPQAGYGSMFTMWMQSGSLRGYRSFGNGGAMRVSPVGFAFDTLDEVLHEARLTALPTHNHREGIKGAQAVAAAVYLARTGHSKDQIRDIIQKRFRYNLERRLEDIRPMYEYDSSCQGSVPQAIIAFLESCDFEDAIRKAVSLGGDSDTIACMAGGISQAFYKDIPASMISQTNSRLDWAFKQVINTFNETYHIAV
jgi:ADP-ribosylglycohydrolase